MPLSTLDQAPLKKALAPSSFAIFLQQSSVPVYIMSAVETNVNKGSFLLKDIMPFMVWSPAYAIINETSSLQNCWATF